MFLNVDYVKNHKSIRRQKRNLQVIYFNKKKSKPKINYLAIASNQLNLRQLHKLISRKVKMKNMRISFEW